MGIFNYIDTFFFISLGITFVLILLLVFHFKQQIVSLEHKNDTMFEIINNIVKEITYIKNAIFSQPQYHINDDDEIINLSVNQIHNKQNIENKIIISDDDDSEDDQDNDTDDENDDDTDDENDDDSEHDQDDDSEDDQDDDSEDDQDNDSEDDKNTLYENNNNRDEETENISNNENGVKLINVEFGNNIEVSETITEIYDDNNEDENENMNNIIHEDNVNILVEKIDIQNNDLDNVNNEQHNQIENIKEVYRKMTLMQLKALVISKGLTSDSSKMRKPELLKLLESNIEENN